MSLDWYEKPNSPGYWFYRNPRNSVGLFTLISVDDTQTSIAGLYYGPVTLPQDKTLMTSDSKFPKDFTFSQYPPIDLCNTSVRRASMTISWDYEEEASQPYYHVYVVGGPLDNDDHNISIILRIPRTPENDREMQTVVDALTAIEARMKE